MSRLAGYGRWAPILATFRENQKFFFSVISELGFLYFNFMFVKVVSKIPTICFLLSFLWTKFQEKKKKIKELNFTPNTTNCKKKKCCIRKSLQNREIGLILVWSHFRQAHCSETLHGWRRIFYFFWVEDVCVHQLICKIWKINV